MSAGGTAATPPGSAPTPGGRGLGRVLAPLRRLGLAARLALVVVGAALLVQAATFLIVAGDRRETIDVLRREQALGRAITAIELLDVTPASAHPRVLQATSSWATRLWLADRPVVQDDAAGGDDRGLAGRLARRLAERLGDRVSQVRVARQGRHAWAWRPDWDATRGAALDDAPPAPFGQATTGRRDERRSGAPRGPPSRWPALVASLELAPGRWLNLRTELRPLPVAPAVPALAATLVTAFVTVAAALVMLHRLTRPLRALGDAADRFGRGEDTGPLEPGGPLEIRRTVQAFEAMRLRLRSFVADRTTMLAALGHDLRTPITSLRLRAELVEDQETRERLTETLDEMQRMVEASLTFTREAGSSEPTRIVDVGALVGSVCADLQDLGQDVTVADAPRLPLPCRPIGLRRAVRNLVANAVLHGERARVAVREGAGRVILVTIEDDGPGIAPADLERAFEPFVRLASASAAGGDAPPGVGLGLAIARTIARAHGGDVVLANLPGGGLRASLSLPLPGRSVPG